MLFSICNLDDSTEAHVNAGREDGGSYQDEDRVDAIHRHTPVGTLLCGDTSLTWS